MARAAAIAIALVFVFVVASSAVPALAATSSLAYTNHTVGGNAGWFFNDITNSSAANYTTWAAPLTFNLGDYLIFNTNSNMTLVQTYNATTYGLCSDDEDDSNETFVYTDDGNVGFGIPETLAVPLTVEGPNYYFSNAGDDGVQCLQGMRFQIKVAHGLGLPPELSQPPPPGSAAAPPSSSPGKVTNSNGAVSGAGAGIWGLVWWVGLGIAIGFLIV